jgi:hypothetical protein
MPLNTCPQPGHSKVNTGILRFLMAARAVLRALSRPRRTGAAARSEQINYAAARDASSARTRLVPATSARILSCAM